MVGFEKALEAVKVVKDQIQYRSQSLLNLARGYFRHDEKLSQCCKSYTTLSADQSYSNACLQEGDEFWLILDQLNLLFCMHNYV